MRVTPDEWVRVTIFAVVVMALTCVPYALAVVNTPNGWQYSGFVLASDDSFSYVGKMRQGLEGYWSFHIFYTAEPHEAAPLTLLAYIAPGQFMRLYTGTDNPALFNQMLWLFHGMRVVLGVLQILVVYRLVAVFIEQAGARFMATLIITVGGGLGILLLPFNETPPEWFIPEAFSFLGMLTLPHLVLGRLTLLAGVVLLLNSGPRSDGPLRHAVFAGAMWVLTGLTVPFYLAVLYVVLGVWGILLWVRNRAFPMPLFIRAVIAGGITLPVFFYYVWLFSANSAMAQWSSQNLLPAPPVWHYALSYGPVVLAGAFAVRSAWRNPDERYLLLLAWSFAGLMLVYLPINVQRRLGEGVFVALGILAVMGVSRLMQSDSGELRRRWLRPALLVTTLPTMLFLLVVTSLGVMAAPRDLYTETSTIEALQWLDENDVSGEERGAAVLSRFSVGTRLPVYAALRSYVGHGPETLNSGEKKTLAEAFFDGALSADEATALVTDPENYIDYVFVGVGDVLPDGVDDLLTEVHREGEIVIYAVE
ncbi:MAG: hypothetical protein AAF787_13205 [Chloroflexota bacterium]